MKRFVAAALIALMATATPVFAGHHGGGNAGCGGYARQNPAAKPAYNALTQDDIGLYVSQRRALLEEKVLEGVITQEWADAALDNYAVRLEHCAQYGGYCGWGSCANP